jgi:hypothetical protein
MYGLKLEMSWDCAPIQNHPGKERLRTCKITIWGRKLQGKNTRQRREEELTRAYLGESQGAVAVSILSVVHHRPPSTLSTVPSGRPLDLGLGVGSRCGWLGAGPHGVGGGREEEEYGGEWGKGERAGRIWHVPPMLHVTGSSSSVSQERASELLFFHAKGYASFGFHGIPRARARNRWTAGSYMREGRSEFPSVSRPQFRAHPNGIIFALNSRFRDSKPKLLHPTRA